MAGLPANYVENARREMAMFDRLPKTLRATLRDTDHNFHSEYVWDKWKGRRPRKCSEVVRLIKALDQELGAHEN
jgi:hypothetical protein